MMDEPTLAEWLDRHHVDIIRTFATTLDSAGVGKYIHRRKFEKSLPRGHAISDTAATMDLTGMPHLTFWHEDRLGGFGDIYLQPDLDTLITDGTDPMLGHCMCDFVRADGEPFGLCSRSLLKKMTAALEQRGFTLDVAFEVEFYLYRESFDEIRRKGYRQPTTVAASPHTNIYMLRNALGAADYMREVIKRLDWQGIPWEGWNDEMGVGQFELNFAPTPPLVAADHVMRTRQLMYEVAREMNMAVTFMAVPGEGLSNGTHLHHSLRDESGSPAFTNDDDKPGPLMSRWVAGQLETLPAAVSFLCPSVNAFRRLSDFSAVPVTPHWGEENKTTAIRTVSRPASAARVEHRVAAGDVNPYLAIAVLIAGGLHGIAGDLPLPPPFDRVAWGLPHKYPRLPNTISSAAAMLKSETILHEMLGHEFVDYWIKTREQEWLLFHTEGGDPLSKQVSRWEYDRYFELI